MQISPLTQSQPTQIRYRISDSQLPYYLPGIMQLPTARDQHYDLVSRGGMYSVNGNYPSAGIQAAIQALFTRLFELPGVVVVSLEHGMIEGVNDPILEVILGAQPTDVNELGAHVGATLELFQQELIETHR